MAIATNEPAGFIAGDSVKWIKNLPDYLPSNGWVLNYVFINASHRHTVAATDNGDGRHLVSIPKATTAGYKSGEYKWFAYVDDGTDRHSVLEGMLTIKPDFSSPRFDPRSHVKKVLDALEAMLENKATEDQQAIQINGRSLTLLSIPDLMKWRDRYKAEYATEKKMERIKKGLKHSGQILARFRE